MANEDLVKSWRRKDCSSSNASSKTTTGTRFKSNRPVERVVAKARARARARAKGEKAQILRARARRVRVFRGVGKSI